MSEPLHSNASCLSDQWTFIKLVAASRDPTSYKIPDGLKVVSVASSRASRQRIDGQMDTVKKALDTCHYLLAQSLVDHYPALKRRLYIDLDLHDAVLETCNFMLEMTIHNIQQDYETLHAILTLSVVTPNH